MRYLKKFLLLILIFYSISTCSTAFGDDEDMWKDWPPGLELETVQFLQENKYMVGYEDSTFRPWEPISEQQVIRVCKRANIRTDLEESQYGDIPAVMKWVEDNFLPRTVFSAQPDEVCTRFRFAVMLNRHISSGNLQAPSLDSPPQRYYYYELILNKWFEQTYVTWNGISRQTKLVGKARVFINEALDRRIPLWLALGQCWRESQWFTTGLSIQYNCGWGIKASPEKWGELSDPAIISGYGNYASVKESIHAYFKYMDEQVKSNGDPLYRNLIDSGQWRSILDIYAPPYENNSLEHYAIVMTVKEWCQQKGLDKIDKERNLW